MTLWILVLIIALFALVCGSGLFVTGAKQVGASLGISQLSIGVLIVIAPFTALGIYEMFQKQYSIRRNYPLFGH